MSPSLVAGAISSPPDTSCATCDNPTLPAATPYQDRLAWVIAVSDPAIASCPVEPAGTKRPSPDLLASDHNYELFLLDATTGGDALDYLQSHVAPCNPSTRIPAQVEVPREQVSVPWSLGTRDPDGYSATITAQVLPCDGHQSTLNLDDNQPSAGVVVERPVAADCGPRTASR
ncbi:MAG TPA: hypothetical protein VKY26_07550 [Actinomycetota bacterium]|nr:hypothetical protein [Actinomycetota bacterium]